MHVYSIGLFNCCNSHSNDMYVATGTLEMLMHW